MESSAIAALVKYFNILSVVVMSLFAILGAVVIFRRKGLPVLAPAGGALVSAFCAAALAAFALEATAFNVQSYLKIFAGPEIEILGASPENPDLLITTGGASAETVSEIENETGVERVGVIFKNLNVDVTSVFVDVEFDNNETINMGLSWTDEMSTANGFQKKLLKRVPRDNYTAIYPYGKVSELKVIFSRPAGQGDESIELGAFALNKRIPFYFSGLRLFVVSFLLFVIICFFKKNAREGAAYLLFEYKFNPSDRKQNIAYVLSVILLILFSYICINTSYPKAYLENPTHQQYNKYLVDALEEGRVWLDYGTPENLLKAERPYDNAYRIANGYAFHSDVMWDWTWYKGKFYCYYGVVPAVILFLPYKLITGEYMSNNGGIFVFSAAIIILMAMLWRFCVKKYMPDVRFSFYILSFFTLFFASGMFVMLRFNRFYTIVQTAGLMFALAGCLLLLKSVENEKINRLKLFFACLCLALIAGCRPNMIFVSLLVPLILWKYRSWKLLAFVAIPYVIVAIPLCAYNYARFDSIFEFGVKYTLTGANISVFGKLNIFRKIIKIILGFVCFFFSPNKYSLDFPFVECHIPTGGSQPGCGMVNFPIVFCLLYMFKNIIGKKLNSTQLNSTQLNKVSWMFIIVAITIAITDSYVMGFSGRFLLDFAVFVILPSLFCAYRWYTAPESIPQKEERMALALVLLTVSVFVGLFLCVSGTFTTVGGAKVHYDPVLYRYLQYSLGVLRGD